MLTTATRPETIHDFGGFPPALYELRYAAPGAPAVAERAIELVRAAGIAANGNGCRGLDHGAWVPLLHMYPQADVPVVQISLQPQLGAAYHLRLGEILAPLRDEGVLIVGSGHMTHNLREWIAFARRHGMQPAETGVEPYVREFGDWVDEALRTDDRDRPRTLARARAARAPRPPDRRTLPAAAVRLRRRWTGAARRALRPRCGQRRTGDGRVRVLVSAVESALPTTPTARSGRRTVVCVGDARTAIGQRTAKRGCRGTARRGNLHF